jgi:hypothetical protein
MSNDGATHDVSALQLTGTYTIGAAPQDYTQTISPAQNVGLTEAITAAQTAIRSQDDPIGFAESIERISVQVRSTDEPVGATDSISHESGLGFEYRVSRKTSGILV